MNVATISMSKAEAKRKLVAYRRELRRRADEEYEAAARGYEALAEGRAILNLDEAIRSGGFDEQMRPRLAVARADREEVRFGWRFDDTRAFFDAHRPQASMWSETLIVPVELGRLHGQKHEKGWGKEVHGYAMVPMVPADVRPFGRLSRYFILWEVEEWSERRHGVQPDRDPYLLERLGGSLYAVVAEWELTELERAVMGGGRGRS